MALAEYLNCEKLLIEVFIDVCLKCLHFLLSEHVKQRAKYLGGAQPSLSRLREYIADRLY